jgi:hypothetical protein
MSKDKSNPAFPSDSNEYGAVLGMSLRDYFAAKALPVAWKAFEYGYFLSSKDGIKDDVATCAYQIADAMIRARSA